VVVSEYFTVRVSDRVAVTRVIGSHRDCRVHLAW